MNVSVAFRQSWFSDLVTLAFFWPLPLLGLPRDAVFSAVAFVVVYQALLHTRVLHHTGPLGWIFNTASYHRLHHGRDEAYRDRNFALVLILWDRLFGTFVRETEPPSFGVIGSVQSESVFKAQVRPMVELLCSARQAGTWAGAARTCFLPPHPFLTKSPDQAAGRGA
jgi:sterol desaturase/sphingolipid hydroxylase (fatty acid hydroxylase superfamily)